MSKAMRDAFGDHLLALGKDHPELVVLDADLSCSMSALLRATSQAWLPVLPHAAIIR